MQQVPETASVTTWLVQVRWGDRRLHAEALDREGRTELTLGRSDAADVALGIDADAAMRWTELGLQVSLSPGITGSARIRGDRPAPLHQLLARGRARELSAGMELLLEPGDTLDLRAGSLRIDIRPAFLPARRLPIDAKVLGTLGLALLAVLLVLVSVVG